LDDQARSALSTLGYRAWRNIRMTSLRFLPAGSCILRNIGQTISPEDPPGKIEGGPLGLLRSFPMAKMPWKEYRLEPVTQLTCSIGKEATIWLVI
jgi:hypothetical protein